MDDNSGLTPPAGSVPTVPPPELPTTISPAPTAPSRRKVFPILIITGVLSVIVAATGYFFKDPLSGLFDKPVSPAPETVSPAPAVAQFLLSKRLIDPADIPPDRILIDPAVPAYSLPLSIADISNYQDFTTKVAISPGAEPLISQNGFAAFATPKNIISVPEEFDLYYTALTDRDIPVFITSDSLLHYYHVFFDTALMRLEKDLFYDDIWQISREFLTDQQEVYAQTADPQAKEAARKNIAYLSVAMELLKPKPGQIVTAENVGQAVGCDGPQEYCQGQYEQPLQAGTFTYFGQDEARKYAFEVPEMVRAEVEAELKLIGNTEGWKCSPIYLYEEDYSQYIPRGHYTRSERLKNYFLAVMWYGRMTNLIKGSPDMQAGICNLPPGEVGTDLQGFVAREDARMQTLAALLLAKKFAADQNIQNRWNRIYAITAFFVGFSDDLGPVEYGLVLDKLSELGSDLTPADLAAKIESAQSLIETDLAKPKIYGGLGNAQMTVFPVPPLTPEQIAVLKTQAETLLSNTQGFRMLGQREVVDSLIFSEIVSPYSGEYTGPKDKHPFTYVLTDRKREVRGFPRGLDIMAIFGSKRAGQIISDLGDADYSEYERVMSEQKQRINALPAAEWSKNLYWNWLYVLRSLTDEFGQGYPTFMQTVAWQDKELATALASWAELRHDTILYVKQSYTMAEMGGGPEERPIVGYVEPVPGFYLRLSNLSKMTRDGLHRLLSAAEMEQVGVDTAMGSFITILDRLLEISKTELANTALTENDYSFIKYFGKHLKQINVSLLDAAGAAERDPDMFKTTLVADVHTDGNSEAVLEEGTGYIKTLAVAYKVPDGRILIGAGPVFSYYEFKQPMKNRLTDEAWRRLLTANPPAEPEWISSFSR